METFESFVALALEDEGLVVSESVKFPVRVPTRRRDHAEEQTHGYEVDLVGACAERLVLASVKSYLGSRGSSPRTSPPRPRRAVQPRRGLCEATRDTGSWGGR